MNLQATNNPTSNPTILVVGDVMTDRYFIGTSTRTSAEVEGLPIVKVSEVLEFDGGAGNVANNLRDLGANSVLVATGPYPIKNRVLLDGVQVARFDEDDYCRPTDTAFVQGLLSKLRVDGVVVSDYGKGAITPHLEVVIAGWSMEVDVDRPVFINTKGDPMRWLQYGMRNCTFVCNQAEYEQWSDAYRRASQVIITQGADGVVRQVNGQVIDSYQAFTKPEYVVSVNGAGDTFLAAYAYASLHAADPHYYETFPLNYASAAAAIVVRKPYTSTATDSEIRREFPFMGFSRKRPAS